MSSGEGRGGGAQGDANLSVRRDGVETQMVTGVTADAAGYLFKGSRYAGAARARRPARDRMTLFALREGADENREARESVGAGRVWVKGTSWAEGASTEGGAGSRRMESEYPGFCRLYAGVLRRTEEQRISGNRLRERSTPYGCTVHRDGVASASQYPEKQTAQASDVHRAAGDGDVYVPSACYAVLLSGQGRRAAFVVGPICDGVGVRDARDGGLTEFCGNRWARDSHLIPCDLWPPQQRQRE